MKNLGFPGKLLFALPMAAFGIFHFMSASNMTGAVPSYLPAPVVWVYLAGAGFLLSAVAIIISKKASLATMLLGFMLIAFALLVHLPGFMDGDALESERFLKALALAGGSLFMSSQLKD